MVTPIRNQFRCEAGKVCDVLRKERESPFRGRVKEVCVGQASQTQFNRRRSLDFMGVERPHEIRSVHLVQQDLHTRSDPMDSLR